MNLVLFDDPSVRIDLFPFTLTRPVSNIRCGILTIDEKWARQLEMVPSYLTESYLQEKYALRNSDDNLLINGAICPDENIVKAIRTLKPGEALVHNGVILASRQATIEIPKEKKNSIDYRHPVTIIDRVWKIFELNASQIKADIPEVTKGRKSQGIQDRHTAVYGEENLFVEEGVTVRAAIINADRGPVYLGKNSIVHEGAVIRGAFALCEAGEVNPGAKIRGDTTIGPHSKVGGEVAAAVVFGYSNKSHDGYMGCSVIGEWCNFGADSNTSNLKNNYDTVKLWSHRKKSYVDTGLQFCGLMMGDHSKCGINSMFNTGTVVDVFANIYGEGFLPTYIPSFSWGGSSGLTTYKLEKALDTAAKVLGRRNERLTDADRKILEHIYAITKDHRTWESSRSAT
ncbi:MAG TPA: GlmU family protein [Cyclobacteriaceae bacterium]|nr:GlmU family protein [Cyclobacteriaceae bacterium]